jgi:hypothetical protein
MKLVTAFGENLDLIQNNILIDAKKHYRFLVLDLEGYIFCNKNNIKFYFLEDFFKDKNFKKDISNEVEKFYNNGFKNINKFNYEKLNLLKIDEYFIKDSLKTIFLAHQFSKVTNKKIILKYYVDYKNLNSNFNFFFSTLKTIIKKSITNNGYNKCKKNFFLNFFKRKYLFNKSIKDYEKKKFTNIFILNLRELFRFKNFIKSFVNYNIFSHIKDESQVYNLRKNINNFTNINLGADYEMDTKISSSFIKKQIISKIKFFEVDKKYNFIDFVILFKKQLFDRWFKFIFIYNSWIFFFKNNYVKNIYVSCLSDPENFLVQFAAYNAKRNIKINCMQHALSHEFIFYKSLKSNYLASNKFEKKIYLAMGINKKNIIKKNVNIKSYQEYNLRTKDFKIYKNKEFLLVYLSGFTNYFSYQFSPKKLIEFIAFLNSEIKINNNLENKNFEIYIKVHPKTSDSVLNFLKNEYRNLIFLEKDLDVINLALHSNYIVNYNYCNTLLPLFYKNKIKCINIYDDKNFIFNNKMFKIFKSYGKNIYKKEQLLRYIY